MCIVIQEKQQQQENTSHFNLFCETPMNVETTKDRVLLTSEINEWIFPVLDKQENTFSLFKSESGQLKRKIQFKSNRLLYCERSTTGVLLYYSIVVLYYCYSIVHKYISSILVQLRYSSTFVIILYNLVVHK